MADLATRFSLIEQEFLDVLSADDSAAMSSFTDKWTKLYSDLEARADSLDHDTKSKIHTVASAISIISSSLLSVEVEADNLNPQLANELETMLDDLDLSPLDPSPPKTTSNLNAPAPRLVPPESSLPPYIEPAYKWLLNHLYNPYPKKAIKQKIAHETGTSLERISEWFVDARRRMGWTRVLREEFNRKRAHMVDAAERFFVRPDPERPLLPIVDTKFAEIQTYAEDMYSAKFIPSALSNKLSAAVKNLTPELKEKAREEKWNKLQARREATKLGIYPSPVTSGASSPISDSGASTSRKRSASDASDVEYSSNKRSRMDDDTVTFVLPSPPYSGPSSPASRKRRLSDADESDAKRLRMRSSSDTVSASITLSGTPELLADWFSNPSATDTDLFKTGQLLDIKFFNPADLEVDEPATSQPAAVASPPETFESPSLDNLEQVFDFAAFNALAEPPLSGQLSYSFIPYNGPAIYEPPSAFVDAYTGGYSNFDNSYLSETITESFGHAVSFSDKGLPEQNSKGRNEYVLYQQPLAFVAS